MILMESWCGDNNQQKPYLYLPWYSFTTSLSFVKVIHHIFIFNSSEFPVFASNLLKFGDFSIFHVGPQRPRGAIFDSKKCAFLPSPNLFVASNRLYNLRAEWLLFLLLTTVSIFFSLFSFHSCLISFSCRTPPNPPTPLMNDHADSRDNLL